MEDVATFKEDETETSKVGAYWVKEGKAVREFLESESAEERESGKEKKKKREIEKEQKREERREKQRERQTEREIEKQKERERKRNSDCFPFIILEGVDLYGTFKKMESFCTFEKNSERKNNVWC